MTNGKTVGVVPTAMIMIYMITIAWFSTPPLNRELRWFLSSGIPCDRVLLGGMVTSHSASVKIRFLFRLDKTCFPISGVEPISLKMAEPWLELIRVEDFASLWSIQDGSLA